MKAPAAILLSIIFVFLAVLHFYWGFGGKWGKSASVPSGTDGRKIINPSAAACFMVAFLLLGAGFFVFNRSGRLFLKCPSWLLHTGTWILISVFLARAIGDFGYTGFFKKVKSTRFAELDTKYYSPLCVLIAALLCCLEFPY